MRLVGPLFARVTRGRIFENGAEHFRRPTVGDRKDTAREVEAARLYEELRELPYNLLVIRAGQVGGSIRNRQQLIALAIERELC